MIKFKQDYTEARNVEDTSADEAWEMLNDWIGFERWRLKTDEDVCPRSSIKRLTLVDSPADTSRSKVARHMTVSDADKTRRA